MKTPTLATVTAALAPVGVSARLGKGRSGAARRLLPLALAVLCAAGPAHAGLFGDDEARRQIAELRDQIKNQSQQLDAGNRARLDLANQNEVLKTELAKLRGQLEEVLYELQSLKQRQQDFYVDLDTRMRKLETAPVPAAAAAAADPAAESHDYELALNLLKDGKYKDALTGFNQFIQKYPDSNLQPNANFWAGNAALQTKDVAAASGYFNTVLAKWPTSTVAPDALLGLANSQQAMGDAKSAQRTLQSVISRFPDSSAAQVAKQRLAKR